MKKTKEPRGATAVDVRLGNLIRTARLQAEITQSELGEKLGVSFQQVQKYEKGKNRVSTGRMAQIAKVLGQPIEHFIGTLHVKQNAHAVHMAEFMATREGNQLVDVAMKLPPAKQQSLINIARQLATA